MKSVLVIDKMPKTCGECLVCGDYGNYLECKKAERQLLTYDKPLWCPLRPLPQKRKTSVDTDLFEQGVDYGWNACLDQITGVTE